MIGPVTRIPGAAPAVGVDATSPAGGVAAVGGDFARVLAGISTDAVSTLKTAEAAAIEGIGGRMPVQQVVAAIMAAEQTLQTAIAVRDKVVAAYQEISRMAI